MEPVNHFYGTYVASGISKRRFDIILLIPPGLGKDLVRLTQKRFTFNVKNVTF